MSSSTKGGRPRRKVPRADVAPALPPPSSPDVPEPSDCDAIARLDELRWIALYRQWCDGDKVPLAEAVRAGALTFGEDMRAFLGDLVEGTFKRSKGGRPSERHPEHERRIAFEIYAAWDAFEAAGESTPKDRACAHVAARRGLEEGACRALIEKVRDDGFTRQGWRDHVAPMLKNGKPATG